MKREIKFRGKNSKGTWLYGDLIHNRGDVFIAPIGIANPIAKAGDFIVDENTVSQFTGLKDKNDKEIYEGDIVKTPMGNIGIIKFGTHEDIVHTREATRQGYNVDCFECTGWIFENIKTKEVVFMDSSVIAGDVIGNIYDNPELLKQ